MMMMKTRIQVIIAFLASAFASEASPKSPAHAYMVQGTVESKTIRWSEATNDFYYDLETNYFDLQVKDCRWLVKLGSQRLEEYDYRIVSSDGASTYCLLSFETFLKMADAAGKKHGVNIGEGTVTSGNIPRFGLAPEAGALWMAYASWCHFAEDSYSHRRPVPFQDYVSDRPVFPGEPPAVEAASWQLSSGAPHLPTMLAYSIENAGSPPSERFFTNVLYQALSFVDFESLRFPKESTVSIYRLQGRSGKKVKQLCQQMRLLATNIAAGVELESFKPRLPGATVITEERFNNGSGLHFSYMSQDNWPSELVARNSEAYKEAKAQLSAGTENFLPNGTNAPDISLLSLVGAQQKKISDYKGQVVVLEFWGTWCPPCQTAIAELQTYAQKFPSWGGKVALITLNLDDDRDRAASHVARKGWTRTENFWISREAVRKYSFEGIPMCYIVDERGNIASAGHDLNIPKDVDLLLLHERGQ